METILKEVSKRGAEKPHIYYANYIMTPQKATIEDEWRLSALRVN